MIAVLQTVPLWAIVALVNAALVIMFAASWISDLDPGTGPPPRTLPAYLVGRIVHGAVLATVALIALVAGGLIVGVIVGVETVIALLRRRHRRAARRAPA